MNRYDIIIIGAGPSGIIAALQAAESELKICILEKMPQVAKKLRLSGKGRCNITNKIELKEFLVHFGKNGRFLRYSFSEFFNTELLAYFEKLGVRFKLERGGRYFLNSDNAEEIANVLVREVKKHNIPIFTDNNVDRIVKSGDEFNIITNTGSFFSKRLLIATGGKSYPNTGSNGEAYKLAKNLGHSLTEILPALVPLKTIEKISEKTRDLNLKNIKLSLWAEKDGTKKKISEEFGEMEFKSYGISGPVVLTISKEAVRYIKRGYKVFVSVDLKPSLDHKKLDNRILREIKENPKKDFKYLLSKLLPQKIIDEFIKRLNIDENKALNQLNGEERKRLRLLLKEFKLRIKDYLSYNNAIITSGGIPIREIDAKTMESKIVKNLYFAGEIIDIDADTGGYNLQAAFSTGYIAGKSMSES